MVLTSPSFVLTCFNSTLQNNLTMENLGGKKKKKKKEGEHKRGKKDKKNVKNKKER